MKKLIPSLLILTVSFFVFSAGSVSAKIITSEKGSVVVGKDEVVNDDLIVGAQSAEIDGTVNGDVFMGAQTAKITGVINGNLHVGAKTLDLSGTVNGNVYGGAQDITVNNSTIKGSLLVGGATVNLYKDAKISGSVFAGAGILSIDSEIERNVYAGAGALAIGRDTKIGKDLYYAEGDDEGKAQISKMAQITGAVHKFEQNIPQKKAEVERVKKQVPAVWGTVKLFATVTSFLGALIVGFLYLKLFGKHAASASDTVTKSFWKSFGIGFLVTIAFIPGLIMLLLTVVGIPLAGVALLIFMLFSYLSKIVTGAAFGNWLAGKFNRKFSAFGTLALGLAIIYVIDLIPFVGFLAGLAVFWTGLGALTIGVFSKS